MRQKRGNPKEEDSICASTAAAGETRKAELKRNEKKRLTRYLAENDRKHSSSPDEREQTV